MNPYILIIDADAQAAKITGAVISQIASTADLKIASNIQDGWSLMQQRWPDLLLIDPSQHQSHALKLIQRIKTVNPATRVVVIASIPTPALRRRMNDLAVDLYFEKPLLLPLCVGELRALMHVGEPDSPPSSMPISIAR